MNYIEWEHLPRKTISSASIFFDDHDNILIAKPNYKEGWVLPGGTVELEESPVEACMREVREEIGLEKKPVSLLCADYTKKMKNGHDHISFVFDGGVLTADEIAHIKLQEEELTEFRFVSADEAVKLFDTKLAKRFPYCMKAHASQQIMFLENGERVKE